MSSSDSDSQQDAAATQTAVQHVIKPAKGGPSLDTSTWPLLLKVSIAFCIHIEESLQIQYHKLYIASSILHLIFHYIVNTPFSLRFLRIQSSVSFFILCYLSDLILINCRFSLEL